MSTAINMLLIDARLPACLLGRLDLFESMTDA